MRTQNQYIVLKWIDELPGFPPYSFATLQHAKELSAHVEWLQQCASLDAAARMVSELNFPYMLGTTRQNDGHGREAFD